MKKVFLILICIIVVLLGIYFNNLRPVKSGEGDIIKVEVKEGLGTYEITKLLKEENVIKDSLASYIYLKTSGKGFLQAGKYELNNSEDTKTVLSHILKGEVASEEIKITFVEGKTIKKFASVIAEKTNNTEEDVYALLKDEEYLDSLIEKYWFLTDEIKDSRIYYSLEGYLLPETYIFDSPKVSVKAIFTAMLDEMEKYLNTYKSEIEDSSLTLHQILTMASIAEQEGYNTEDRANIIGVFFNRLRKGMSLGSDVTTYYAFGVDMAERDITAKEINTENPYNTRGPNMNGKIPVGPICNPSKSAIEAAIEYKENDYFYFVSDKNGKTYFTKNYQEHQAIIKKLKNEGLWFTY